MMTSLSKKTVPYLEEIDLNPAYAHGMGGDSQGFSGVMK